MTHTPPQSVRLAARTSHRSRRGITLVELLVVITIIALLIGLITVGLSAAIRQAKGSATSAAVNAIGQGVETLRADFGNQAPPLVTEPPKGGGSGAAGSGGRAMFVPQMLDNAADRRDAIFDARYHSEWTLGIFLLGDSDVNGDGRTTYSEPGNEQPNLDDGFDGPGFRDPGSVFAWKRRDRLSGGEWVHKPAQTGRVYGPYVEPGIEDYVQTVNNNGAQIKQFVDAFGNPIRYYRGYVTVTEDKTQSSSHFMPQELQTREAAQQMKDLWATGLPDDSEPEGQSFRALSREILNADYVILAANDDPGNWLTGSGEQIAPFGDVTIDSNGNRFELEIPSFNGPMGLELGPFDPTLLSSDTKQIAFSNYVKMVKSNVRFTP